MNDAARPPGGILKQRQAGVLLHPSSLPGGTLGPDDGAVACEFLDFLARTGCGLWQILPLGPTGDQRSPYSPVSAFAGNTKLLAPHDGEPPRAAVDEFAGQERSWLPDYALFVALKNASNGAPWWEWPAGARDREPATIEKLRRRHADEIRAVCNDQFVFARTWRAVRAQAHAVSVRLCGDLPMFPVTDSADVWTHRELFKLRDDGKPAFTAGVPPDAFAEDGQHWGNPVFDWQALRERDFSWWRDRVRHELRHVDLLRWDHFRGLVATWEIPYGAPTAREGEWREVPGRDLLAAIVDDLGELPIIAENLGTITPEVEDLRRNFGLPGMHVLQFAFDGTPDNPHLPENHEEQGVAYTGTHDNDTTTGWFRSLDEQTRDAVLEYTGGKSGDLPWPMIETVLASRARLAIVPMQDYLSLDSQCRMNRPGVAEGNWTWQLEQGALSPALADRIAAAVTAAARNQPP